MLSIHDQLGDLGSVVKIKNNLTASKPKNNIFMNNFNNIHPISKSLSRYHIMQTTEELHNEKLWTTIIPSAAYFHVYNSVLGDVFIMVYSDNNSNSNNDNDNIPHRGLSTFMIDKCGCSFQSFINISENSKYFPAIENLSPHLKSSKVRKALAISLLKNFSDLDDPTVNLLYEQANLSPKTFDWDETQAGLLASQMTLLDKKSPTDIGSYLFDLGYLAPNLSTASYVVDVLYNDQTDNNLLTEQNNALAFLIGKQLEQLFDPLTEYSPEPTEKAYKIPIDNSTNLFHDDDNLIRSICSELITVQTNYTVSLVQFLQNFVVPLRIQALEGKLPGFTTSKLNQIFPPTIDEVTRINCIFLDMLKLAEPYGSYEILKACGTTIPYFYKAQMRHEAAIKNFHSNYLQFAENIKNINRLDLLSFDQRTIETSVYSSLNLVKIQLIIKRLVKNKNWPLDLKENVQIFLDSCDNTISSFANDKLQPYNGRIFTPTGKILAEIAKGWPSELQYGWLTRRVVAVFDATDILLDNVKNRSVIIVFSDTVLFLSLDDDEYYSNLWKGTNMLNLDIESNPKSNTKSNSRSFSNSDIVSDSIHKPSISDILIHSLTNETPLTKLPHMTVKFWANINSLHALYYTSSINVGTDSKNPKSYVRFFNEADPSFTGIYQLDKVSGKYVTEVLARAKILNKSQSFHLFCGSVSDTEVNLKEEIVDDDNDKNSNNNGNNKSVTRRVYYTAHEKSTYEKENTKSPFLVLFNQEFKEDLLYKYGVYAIITLNFITEDKVRLEGLSRYNFSEKKSAKISYDVHVDVLSDSLSLILNELFTTHMTLDNPMIANYLLMNNQKVNSQALKMLSVSSESLNSKRLKIFDAVMKNKREQDILNNIASDKSNRRKSLELLKADLNPKKYSRLRANNEKGNAMKNNKNMNKTKKEEKSSNRKFFNFFNKSTKPKPQSVDTIPERKSSVIYKRMSIRKKEVDYSQLKPAKPKQKKNIPSIFSHTESNSRSSSIDNDDKKRNSQKIMDPVRSISKSAKQILNHNLSNSQGDNTTLSTSIYVNSHFEFPMEPISNENIVKETHDHIVPVSPRLAKLKDEPNPTKGYKDSVDLMGKLNTPNLKADSITNYDGDLFELTSSKNDFRISECHGPIETTIHTDPSLQKKAGDAISQPKVRDITPKTPINYIKMEDVHKKNKNTYNNDGLCDTRKNNEEKTSKHLSELSIIKTRDTKSNKHSTKCTIPTNLQRSQSFYTRFQNMRKEQENILKTNGISFIHDLNELPAKDRNILSRGFAFSPSISSNLGKIVDEEGDENKNWILFDVNNQESINECVTLSEFKEVIKPATIATKFTKVVLPKKQLHINRNISEGSSVYLSPTEDELNRFGSVRVKAHNPYSMGMFGNSLAVNAPENSLEKADDDERDKLIDTHMGTQLYGEEFYQDDVDLLGDVDLGKMDFEFSVPDLSQLSTDTLPYDDACFSNVNHRTRNSSNANVDKVLRPDFSIKELTLGDMSMPSDVSGSLGIDTSLCSALVDNTEANILLDVWGGNGCEKIKNNTIQLLPHLPHSETIQGLNALMMDKSYAYLHDFINGEYEEHYNQDEKKPDNECVEIKHAVTKTIDLHDHSGIVSKNNSFMKRDVTDYDLVYSKKLLNSSVHYLSSYYNNEMVI